jgi:TolB protein
MKRAALLVVAAVSMALATHGSAAPRAFAGRIAFESTRTGDSDIWIMAANGKAQVNLTHTHEVQESTPALSPDGKRIAFVRSAGERSELWLMNADGSGQRRLGAGKGSDLNPVWSPAGDRIAFASLLGRNWDVYVTTLNGSRTQLTTDAASEVDVSWDPNGKQLVVDRIERGTSDLWLLTVESPKLARLTSTPSVAELNPAWSPKGNEVAYDASVHGVYDLYALNVETKKVRPITRDAADDGDPSWAPDGSAIAYRRGGGADYEIAVVSASAGGRPQIVSRDAIGLDIAPSWSVATGAFANLRTPAQRTKTEIVWVFACDAAWPGTPNPDSYVGNLNINHMCGDGAGDNIHASDGGDWLSGGTGTDLLYGENHGDKLKARDSTKDYVRGGSGIDYALLDAADSVTYVEYPSY